MMRGLFDDLDSDLSQRWASRWTAEPLPVLNDVDELFLDFEVKGRDGSNDKNAGLKWWDGARPCGFSWMVPDGRAGYCGFGHIGAGVEQHCEATAKRWMHEQLKGKLLTNLNTRYEVHIAREWGVDLEEVGCRVSDVSHYAALLDDHRHRFSLEALVNEFLDESERKVKVVEGVALDPTRMAYYPPAMVAHRAIADVRQVKKLKEIFWPQLTEQDLQRVRQLEDDIIYVVCEMEKNGLKIDVELLDRWTKEVEQEYLRGLWTIHRETGLKFNPDSRESWERLFYHLNIPIEHFTTEKHASFTDSVLQLHLDKPMVALGRRVGKLADLLSKFLLKYKKAVDHNGIIRFALHQLRGDDGGTISGRFSGASLIKGDPTAGINPQQVLAVEKQKTDYGPDYLIRQLFVAGSGHFLSADAMQIEYRIFADYAKNPKVLEAYQRDWGWLRSENPDPDYEPLSFHKHIWGMLLPSIPDLGYKPLKNLNFAKIYGAGLAKLCAMLGYITEHELAELRMVYPKGVPKNHPKLAKGLEVDNIYARELPEVRPLMELASRLATQRGFVKTSLGRRSRFIHGFRSHKGLNAVIQGTAADYNKMALIELHKERRNTGLLMRVTNHDEVCGDAPNEESARAVQKVLNRQLMPHMLVPILWDCKIGASWAACK